MRWPSLLGSSKGDLALILATLGHLPFINAVSFTPAPSTNLDISQLGRVAFAGSFDSISLYNYIGQDEDGLHTNGSQSILGRYPDGAFADLQSADASINAMCPFLKSDGSLAGVIIAGNFTSLGGQEAQAAALFDPTTGAVTPLSGLTGQVNTVYCDNTHSIVYFGGSFSAANSTNAIAWTNGWTNLPFQGFNGPVYSITEMPDGNIAFGGSFTGIGNVTSPTTPNAQVVNVGSANVTTSANTTTQMAELDATNIICRTGNSSTPGWVLPDNAPGFWQANFGFGFRPTKLRLYNSQMENYGTRNWLFRALPSNGIMNFTYYDGQGLQTCTSNCLLLNNNNTYQDFYFVNVVGMNGFQLEVESWYGNGGGLGGIELFQDDIYSFAINAFNEPHCDSVSQGSNSTTTGPWQNSPNYPTTAQYLTANLEDGTQDSTDLSVVFMPDIRQSGNYSVTIYTPGCQEDNTCSTRGQVNVTGTMFAPSSPSAGAAKPISSQIFETNTFDKYDEIYYGYVDASSSSFRPTVTLTPSLNQKGPITIVAQRVRWELVSSTGGLNGLFEFNPNDTTITTDYSSSPLDMAGTSLDSGAQVNNLVVENGVTYAAGNFSSKNFSNIMALVNNNATDLANGGLNQPVESMYQADNFVYVGGNFTSTRDNSVQGLSHVAAYNMQSKTWQPLGAGVNGIVWDVIPLTVNISSTDQEAAISISGYFDQVYGFDSNAALTVANLAVWVPSKNNWLQNLGTSSISLSGRLNAQTTIPHQQPLYAGNVDSQTFDATNAIGLASASGNLNLEQLAIMIQPQQTTTQTSKRKRAVQQQTVDGVVTGLFYEENNLDLTILAGHFSVKGTNGSMIENLAIINGSQSNHITGLANGNSSTESAILALETTGTTLWAGGSISNGFISYDLALADLTPSQPPALTGTNASVNAIAARPSSSVVFFGGSFRQAGSLDCPGLCQYDTSTQQWTVPGSGLVDGSTVTAMKWANNNQIILAGNMTVGNSITTLARYDAKANVYSAFEGADNAASIPGPITAFSALDNTYTTFFVAGTSTSNNSAFISKFTPSSSGPPGQIAGTWTSAISATEFGPATQIESLQVMAVSKSHASSPLIGTSQVLLITGLLELQNFGNASAAVFNGTSFEPFILSTMADSSPGSIRNTFVQNPQNLLNAPSSHRLAVGFIVLIALAIALGLIFLLVVLGILAERIRRRREGYVRAPTSYNSYEKHGAGNVGAIPPEHIFGGVRGSGNGSSDESRGSGVG